MGLLSSLTAAIALRKTDSSATCKVRAAEADEGI